MYVTLCFIGLLQTADATGLCDYDDAVCLYTGRGMAVSVTKLSCNLPGEQEISIQELQKGRNNFFPKYPLYQAVAGHFQHPHYCIILYYCTAM